MPMIYQSINQAVFERIPKGTRSLLDVGCGGGVFGAAVKAARPCEVVGVTYSEAEAVQARQRLNQRQQRRNDALPPRAVHTAGHHQSHSHAFESMTP